MMFLLFILQCRYWRESIGARPHGASPFIGICIRTSIYERSDWLSDGKGKWASVVEQLRFGGFRVVG